MSVFWFALVAVLAVLALRQTVDLWTRARLSRYAVLLEPKAQQWLDANPAKNDLQSAFIGHAVAAARGTAALSMIRQYKTDKDPRVRETASRVYAQLAG